MPCLIIYSNHVYLIPDKKKITEVLSPLNCFIVFFYNTDILDVYMYYLFSIRKKLFFDTHSKCIIGCEMKSNGYRS